MPAKFSFSPQSIGALLIVSCLVTGALHAAEPSPGRLIVSPAPESVLQNGDFGVKVRTPGGNWQELASYLIKVDAVRKRDHSPENSSLASFDFAGTAEVAVTFRHGEIQSARIRPLSCGIQPEIKGNTLTFSLSQPRNLSVEVNGDIFHNLHLFANPIEESRPDPNDPNVIYYGPGLHVLPDKRLSVSSGQTVYLAGGAVVRGQILIEGAQNVRVLGRGMIDQSTSHGLRIANSKNVEFSGIFGSQFFTGGSQNVTIRNVKCISNTGWGDGMDVICCSDVLIDGVFNRNSDDCIAIYAKRAGFAGGSRSITVQNSTLWADVAHPILVGTHGNTPNPETIEDLRFSNLDILDQMEPQLDYQGCMSLNAGDDNLIRNVRFEDIRVEDFRLGQLVNLRVFYNRKYNTSPGRGIENVLFKNVTYNGQHANPSLIAGYDDARKVKNIVFEDLAINGTLISDHMVKPGWFKTSDMANFFIGEHVEGVEFRSRNPTPKEHDPLPKVQSRPESEATHPAASLFVHPGMLHSAADLARMKSKVAQGIEPWAGAWRGFTDHNRWLAADYTPRPLEVVGRGVGATGMDNISNDCTAAYYNAIAWNITGEERYARKSVEIMNAWASKCREINGKDAVLCAGIYGYKLANAAEIMRATYKDWPEPEILQFKHLLREVFYPVIKDFATFANGNWDAAAEAAMISFGVFLDDRAMFERAERYYMAGAGNGSILHYVLNDTGQLQETGRDQGHAQLGIGLLSCVAEMAWHQGNDLYGAFDNRLLKGFEYTARYNLGEDIPFEPTTDRTGKYLHEHASARGKPTMQVYEMVAQHYANRAGVPTPYTERAAAAYRPESLAIDQVGGGTLLFSLLPDEAQAAVTAPAIPGPVIATASDNGISLQWAASVGASSYTVKRAESPVGPFTVLAADVKSTAYTDGDATRGRVFYYEVSAVNAVGSSAETLPGGASAGLPVPWTQSDIGGPPMKGETRFDGSIFTLESSGKGIGGKADECHFASLPLKGDGTLVARYVPQTPSQFARMGLMLRESSAPDARAITLLITPQTMQDIEVPHWHVELSVRATTGGEIAATATGTNLEAPVVTWGRLMAPLWLRLNRVGNTFTASISADGQQWTPVGSAESALPSDLAAGLVGCSGLKVSTTMMFDHVTVPTLR